MKEPHITLLENKYEEWKLHSLMGGYDECDLNKYEFVGDEIFNFVTYDNFYTIKLTMHMLEVLDVLIKKYNYSYLKEEDQYSNYLLMINMPFLINKIEWGTSIKGAWLDESKLYEILQVEIQDIVPFIKTLLEWVKE